MKKVVWFVLIVMSMFLSSCAQMNTASTMTAIVGDTSDASTQIDQLQKELGVFSQEQWAIVELDRIQNEIKYAMLGNVSLTKIKELRNRSIKIYLVFKKEATERWDSILPEQQYALQQLDYKLEKINNEIIELLKDADNADTNTKIMMKILDFSVDALKVYRAYGELVSS